MPCNIGYRSVSRVTIPAPQPLTFRRKVTAPEVDEGLMDRLGESDPVFVEWIGELDKGPLLEEALKRARDSVKTGGRVRYEIRDGGLAATATYTGAAAKRAVEREVELLSGRWTFEVLGIVLQLLDYDIRITETADDGLTLEGEKRSDKSVHEYVRITQKGREAGELRFEHFGSPEELEDERDRFVALSDALGVRLRLVRTEERGQPIPQEVVHRDFFRLKE